MLPAFASAGLRPEGPASCWRLLTNDSPQKPAPTELGQFKPSQLEAVTKWAIAFGLPGGYSEFLQHNPQFSRFLSEQNLSWTSLNEPQKIEITNAYLFQLWWRWNEEDGSNDSLWQRREFILSQELHKLAPKDTRGNLIVLDEHKTLARLSHSNKERLLQELNARYPVPEDIRANRGLNFEIDSMVESLRFHFMRARPYEADPSLHEPIVSLHALTRAGLTSRNYDFFSDLMGETNTVEFRVVPTHTQVDIPASINGTSPLDSYSLDRSFARDSGYLLPVLHSVSDVFNLFDAHEPEAIGDLFRYLRYSLPSDVAEGDRRTQLQHLLTPGIHAEIFPKGKMFANLTPLRTRLQNYVLTVEDGEDYLREALRLYILSMAAMSPRDFKDVVYQWKIDVGAQALFKQDVMTFAGLPSGLALHVPEVVPAKYYHRVLVQPVAYNPFPARVLTRGLKALKKSLPHQRVPRDLNSSRRDGPEMH